MAVTFDRVSHRQPMRLPREQIPAIAVRYLNSHEGDKVNGFLNIYIRILALQAMTLTSIISDNKKKNTIYRIDNNSVNHKRHWIWGLIIFRTMGVLCAE